MHTHTSHGRTTAHLLWHASPQSGGLTPALLLARPLVTHMLISDHLSTVEGTMATVQMQLVQIQDMQMQMQGMPGLSQPARCTRKLFASDLTSSAGRACPAPVCRSPSDSHLQPTPLHSLYVQARGLGLP